MLILFGTIALVCVITPFYTYTFFPALRTVPAPGFIHGAISINTEPLQSPHIDEPSSRSNDNLRSILDNANTAYVLFDRELRVITFNQLAVHFVKTDLGADLQEGMRGIDYFPAARQQVVEAFLLKALKGTPTSYEVSYLHEDGSATWYEVSIYGNAGISRQITGAVMALNNITERKMMVLQREKMTEELMVQNKHLQQFAYMVSHNLRAPLSNIIGSCEVLKLDDLPEHTRSGFIQGILISSKKLDEVIIDMNDILHMKQDASEPKEAVNLSVMTEEIRDSLEGACKQSGVRITTDFSEVACLHTMKTYLHNIFYNLISNGIKYRREGVIPEIRVKSFLHTGRMELVFTDNGLGIDLDKHGSKVFDLYKRFHHEVEGKGMGLFMTRTQVESLGGTISVHSRVGEGSEFRISFPL